MNTSENWKNEKLYGNTTPQGQGNLKSPMDTSNVKSPKDTKNFRVYKWWQIFRVCIELCKHGS